MSTQFSDRIKAIMEEHDLSAKDFAEMVSVQRSSISHLISGRNKPSVDFIVKLTSAFPEINPHWLLHGKGNSKITTVNPSEVTNVSSTKRLESTVDTSDVSSDTNVTKDNPKSIERAADTETKKDERDPVLTQNEGGGLVQNKSSVKKIRQIILVYSDGSFEVLEK